MNHRLLLLNAIALSVLATPIAWVGWLTWQRPAQTNIKRSLFEGVQYQREFRQQPRPMMIHVLTVDLAAKGVRVLVTPGQARSMEWETTARTTSEVLQDFKLQAAVNASFFHPFKEQTPWDYYPRKGDRVGVVGHAISGGVEYSAPLKDWSVLCISANQKAEILSQPKCPPGTAHAVAGSHILLQDGKMPDGVRSSAESDNAYARTVVAVDKTGKKLWVIAVDAKQWLYSEGGTLPEVANFAHSLGAEAAINLDGGGSTTLAMQTSMGYQILNVPIHTKIPMRERPVANHLGVYALPLSPLPK